MPPKFIDVVFKRIDFFIRKDERHNLLSVYLSFMNKLL